MVKRRTSTQLGVWPPKVAGSSWSFQPQITSGKLDVFKFPEFAKEEFGIHYIELLVNHLIPDDEPCFQKFAEAAAKSGVEIVCLALSNDFTDGAQLDSELQKTRKLLGVAKTLRASIVRLNPGMIGAESDAKVAEHVAFGLKQLLPEAQKQGVILALENHQLFGMKPSNIIRVMDELGVQNNLGVCLDFGNFYPEELATGPIKLAPYAVHAHAKIYEINKTGSETTIDYLARLRELRKSRYTGFVSIEWEGDNPDDTIDGVRSMIRLIERCTAA